MRFFQSDSYRRAAAVILGTEQPHQKPVKGPATVEVSTYASAGAGALPRASERPPAPRVVIRPEQPTASAVEIAASVQLSTGASKVWGELHRLALEVHTERMTLKVPDALTFHLPAVILAALVGYSERHLKRLLNELNAAGLIHSKGHTSKVGYMRRYDGTLFCVALKVGARPRLRFWDFQADWRPGYETDYHGEKGAWREVQEAMSEPPTSQGDKGRVNRVARAWAVGSRHVKNPVKGGSDMRPSATFMTLAADLPGLLGMHPKQRHRAVSEWGAALSTLLGEPHRLKQWCGVVYRALGAENQLRPALERMAAELWRFGSELRQGEGESLRNAGAVLAARFKTITL